MFHNVYEISPNRGTIVWRLCIAQSEEFLSLFIWCKMFSNCFYNLLGISYPGHMKLIHKCHTPFTVTSSLLTISTPNCDWLPMTLPSKMNFRVLLKTHFHPKICIVNIIIWVLCSVYLNIFLSCVHLYYKSISYKSSNWTQMCLSLNFAW